MKVICIENCFYSKGLKKFDKDQTYDLDNEMLSALNSAKMLKRFTDTSGNPIGKSSISTADTTTSEKLKKETEK